MSGTGRQRISTRRLRSFDGTRLTYYVTGPETAPPMVLCSGLGGGFGVWRPFLRQFAGRFRMIGWDYRGLYRSDPAPDRKSYTLAHHAEDLLHVLRAERVEAPLLVGWSMGVQVALELHRSHPDWATGLVAIQGVAGRPLDTAFESPLTARVSPIVLGLLRRVGGSFQDLGPRLAGNDTVLRSFVWSAQRLGLMAEQIDLPSFGRMAVGWTRLHLGNYADIFEELGEHDASDLLPEIRTPALVVAGDADPLTPLSVAERMVASMPNASLEVVKGATHFSLLEYPDDVLERVERFLETHPSDPNGY